MRGVLTNKIFWLMVFCFGSVGVLAAGVFTNVGAQAPITDTDVTPIPETAMGIYDMKIVPLSDGTPGYSIKWRTAFPTKGRIEYQTSSGSPDTVGYDVRGTDFTGTEHEVVIMTDSIESEVPFVIVSDGKRYDNNGAKFQMRAPVQNQQQPPVDDSVIPPGISATPVPDAILEMSAISAVNGGGFTVKWKTALPTKGWIMFGVDVAKLDQIAYDDRGAEVADTMHSVAVRGAKPGTKYRFAIMVDQQRFDNAGNGFEVIATSEDGALRHGDSPSAGNGDDDKTTGSPNSNPSSPSTLQCDPEVYYGVRHCTDNGVGLLVVDLTDPHVRVQTVLSRGANGECNSVNHNGKDSSSNCPGPCYPGETVKAMLERYKASGAVAAINTDYFGNSPASCYDHGAQGLAVRNGVRLDGPSHGVSVPWPARIAYAQPSLSISSANVATIGIPGSQSAINASLGTTYYNTVAGAPIIVQAGQAVNTSCPNIDPNYPYPGNTCSSASQSAAGLTSDRRLVLITAQQNAGGVANYLINNYSVHSALKFDGGGSARLAWLDGAGQAQHFGGTSEDRPVAEALVIFSSRRPSSCLAESPHPYSNNYNNTWTLTNPNSSATATRIHFSRIETESGYDY
ncbi:MAG: phosphodiester glycosidase family protein, partial [Anaerolineae bacterium]